MTGKKAPLKSSTLQKVEVTSRTRQAVQHVLSLSEGMTLAQRLLYLEEVCGELDRHLEAAMEAVVEDEAKNDDGGMG